jgi:hypothetical protein
LRGAGLVGADLVGADLVGAWFGRRELYRCEAGGVVGTSSVAVVLVGARRGEIPAVPRARGARGGLV